MSNFPIDLAREAALAGHYPQEMNERERKIAESVKAYVDGHGGGGGTVTSVALTAPGALLSVAGSPVTSSGTLALSLNVQAANTVLAGPTTGSAAAPTFRALVASDLPGGGGGGQPSTHVAWPAAAGSSFTATHNLATQLLIIQVIDAATFATIETDSVIRSTANQATLTSSETPGAAGWIVLFQGVS